MTEKPINEVLRDHNFIEVTGLREYLFGFIPTPKKVGANLLATQLSCRAIIGKQRFIQDSSTSSHESTDHMYMVVVTQDGKVWVGRPRYDCLHRLTDRSDDPAFKHIVRLHRLRAVDLLASVAGEPLDDRD